MELELNFVMDPETTGEQLFIQVIVSLDRFNYIDIL